MTVPLPTYNEKSERHLFVGLCLYVSIGPARLSSQGTSQLSSCESPLSCRIYGQHPKKHSEDEKRTDEEKKTSLVAYDVDARKECVLLCSRG